MLAIGDNPIDTHIAIYNSLGWSSPTNVANGSGSFGTSFRFVPVGNFGNETAPASITGNYYIAY